MKLKLLTEADREVIIECLKKLPLSDTHYNVEWTKHRKRRSLPQNRLYWLWMACIANETGYTSDEMHDHCRKEFLTAKRINLSDRESEVSASTKSLNTAEFKAYLDKIQVWSLSELGCVLPNPEDLHFQQFYEYYKDKL